MPSPGDQMFGLAADVRGVPRRPGRTQAGQYLEDGLVAVQRPGQRGG
jgi:hypothetical protein